MVRRQELMNIGRHFDRLHVQLAYLRERIDKLGDETAAGLLNEMEFGLLAPMRRLRNHLSIPYNWQEDQETGNGPSDEDSDGELLCETGS